LIQEETGWRTSSHTTGQGNCVEVGQVPDAIVVRDTKNRTAQALSMSPEAWRDFVTGLKC
jgi:hypothetical protein